MPRSAPCGDTHDTGVTYDSKSNMIPPGPDPVLLETKLPDVLGNISHETVVRQQLSAIIGLLTKLVEKESKDG